MSNVVRLTYDGKTLPPELGALRPRFLLEAIPEILEVKKSALRDLPASVLRGQRSAP